MDDILETVVIACMVMMFLSVVFLCAWMYPPLHEAKKLDCSIAEFSPDISTEIKQLCREARRNK
jgi:hypothetical protein